MDVASYKELKTAGEQMPFDAKAVVITSLNYASKNAEEIRARTWL